jgi:hypothetical protein
MLVGWRTLDLLRGSWQGARRTQQMVMSTFGLAPLLLLLNAREQAGVTLKHPALDQAHYGATLGSLNHLIALCVEVMCIITLLYLLWEVWKMALDVYHKRAAEMK